MQIICSTLGAYHMQHVMCHMVQGDRSAVDRVDITFILALCHWLKPLTDAGGEETRVP